MSTAPVPRPWARWLHADELAALKATIRHCETRKCRNPVAIITWRWWRSSELGGKVLVTEHFVCSEHGTGFATRHHIPVDPAAEVEVRHLGAEEAAALEAEGRHCDWPGCLNAPAWMFSQSFAVRGEPRAAEDLSCTDHVRQSAARLHVPMSGEGGAR
jgi:hypothetical protein